MHKGATAHQNSNVEAARPLGAPRFSISVDDDFGADQPHLGRPQQARVGESHRVDRPVEFASPEIQELLELREAGRDVVVLPDVRLEQGLCVGHPIVYLGRRERPALELTTEVRINWHNSPLFLFSALAVLCEDSSRYYAAEAKLLFGG